MQGQDSDNRQIGLYIEVPLYWPDRLDSRAAVLDLLARFPGRSIVARVHLDMQPQAQWTPLYPNAVDYVVSPPSWTCAAFLLWARLTKHNADGMIATVTRTGLPHLLVVRWADGLACSLHMYMCPAADLFELCNTCRQLGSLDTPSVFVGFAGYKYRPGVGLTPNLADAFKPVSTSFQVVTSQVTADGTYTYDDTVRQCRSICGAEFDKLDPNENYVAVSVAATPYKQTREKLNIASFFNV